MKKGKIIIYILFSFIFINWITANNKSNISLKALDKALQNKTNYIVQKQNRIDSLKIELKLNNEIEEQTQIVKELCLVYSSFQKDSALNYAIQMKELSQKNKNKEIRIEAKIIYARILSSMGFFREALLEINSIESTSLPSPLKIEYFIGQATIYDHQKMFATNEKKSYENGLIAQSYRDSLLKCTELPPFVKIYTTASYFLFHEKYDATISMLDSVYLNYPRYSHNIGILTYSLASAYKGKKNQENAIKYFAISAMSDVLSGTRENRSLRILAKLLFERGDLDRAFLYMKNAMEDAILCSARINAIETSDIYFFYSKIFQEKERQKAIVINSSLVISCTVCVFLSIAFLKLKKQKRKIKQINESLSYHLGEIRNMNSKLADNNRIKEEYIGLYMEQYFRYISQMNIFKKKILKITKNGDITNILTFLNSTLKTENDLAEFYNQFDQNILNLFPNFITDFNALLLPENMIIPKADKMLTPELRIFALIRLGITDNTKIAKFLQYSLSTIYNYRSKIRNKANGDRSKFEERVCRIGL